MRDECEHGSLRRSCDICRLEADNGRLVAENEKLRKATALVAHALAHVECVDVEGPGFMLRPKAYVACVNALAPLAEKDEGGKT